MVSLNPNPPFCPRIASSAIEPPQAHIKGTAATVAWMRRLIAGNMFSKFRLLEPTRNYPSEYTFMLWHINMVVAVQSVPCKRRPALAGDNQYGAVSGKSGPGDKTAQGDVGAGLGHAVQIKSGINLNIAANKLLTVTPVEAGHRRRLRARRAWRRLCLHSATVWGLSRTVEMFLTSLLDHRAGALGGLRPRVSARWADALVGA
jgi:hypothetical protein